MAALWLLLPAVFLGLVLALGRYEEHLLTPRPVAQHRRPRTARHARR
ncbi:hypothetical protein [Streptomyces chryseus]|nr:hypothetical protein [Streptomyces chryseus]GGX41347.1 hypothetical protein GCM10010353_65850 [Streptomyces chryseus]